MSLLQLRRNSRSPSVRGCGLKSCPGRKKCTAAPVTLSARVWIEIAVADRNEYEICVTLSARVWIEISKIFDHIVELVRHPQCEGVD